MEPQRWLSIFWAVFLAVLLAGPRLEAQTKTPSKAKKDKAAEISAAAEKALLAATRKVDTTYLADLEKIASWAAGQGLKAEAAKLVAKMADIDPEYPKLEKLKASIGKPAAKKKASAKDEEEKKSAAQDPQKALQKKIEEANDRYAARLFPLAESCMKYGLFTRAYRLVKAVLDADPDHKKARGILSYAWDSSSKKRITKWEADMKKTHFLTPEGWFEKKRKSDFDKGLRPYQGKWLPKEKEAEYRKRNNYNPFAVETEHFEVQTLLGREKAFEFGLRLEDFYRQFFEFYLGFYDQVQAAKLLFNTGKQKKKHQVFVFPSRVEYLEFVKADHGDNELLRRSGGFWSPGERKSYFFWTDRSDENMNTLYHEVTHQLLGETKDNAGRSEGNTWLVEGIAAYMETWENEGGRWHPGARIDSPALMNVKSLLAGDPKWSLESYLAMDHETFHKEPGRGMNYALGAALAHFFLHYGDEIYREDFIRFLKDYYEGKVVKDSLAKYIRVEGATGAGEKLSTLSAQFREYMKDLRKPGSAPPAAEAESEKAGADAKS